MTVIKIFSLQNVSMKTINKMSVFRIFYFFVCLAAIKVNAFKKAGCFCWKKLTRQCGICLLIFSAGLVIISWGFRLR